MAAFKKIFKYLAIIIAVILILNLPVTTRQGVNYKVKILKIPLYIKIVGFIERDYWYRRIADEITAESRTNEEKVMAIFQWVEKNIHKVPAGFDVVDDHVLNILIRRYGSSDQKTDLFTTLSAYAGLPAFWRIEYQPERKHRIVLSYVLVDDRWLVFDIYHDTFFLNKKGRIASVDDIIADISIVKEKDANLGGALSYGDFFKDMKPIKKDFISKEEKQMPFSRILYEIQRFFRGRRPSDTYQIGMVGKR